MQRESSRISFSNCKFIKIPWIGESSVVSFDSHLILYTYFTKLTYKDGVRFIYTITRFLFQIMVKFTISMSEKMLMSLYDEIVKIRQLLEITLKDDLKKELEGVLTTKERKTVWASCDGFTDTRTIARKVGISRRAVQITVRELQEAELLVVERRGFPKRKFDYVPFDWEQKETG